MLTALITDDTLLIREGRWPHKVAIDGPPGSFWGMRASHTEGFYVDTSLQLYFRVDWVENHKHTSPPRPLLPKNLHGHRLFSDMLLYRVLGHFWGIGRFDQSKGGGLIEIQR